MAHTKILLRQDVDDLGARGEIVRVRAGYARNYLLPRKLAVEATANNVKQIEQERAALLKKEANERTTAEGQAEQISKLVLEFKRKSGEQGALYGSVTSMDIAEALKERIERVEEPGAGRYKRGTSLGHRDRLACGHGRDDQVGARCQFRMRDRKFDAVPGGMLAQRRFVRAAKLHVIRVDAGEPARAQILGENAPHLAVADEADAPLKGVVRHVHCVQSMYFKPALARVSRML